MAKLKLAYGLKDDIQSAVSTGKVPPGTMILTKDTNEMYFYNLEHSLCAYQEKYKFTSKMEAEDWVSKYDCKGSILSVRVGDKAQIYVVDYDNKLVKFENKAPEITQIQSDWNETDPESLAYIKNKPDMVSSVLYSSSEDIENLFT